jgi:hypothetical protein
MWHVGRRGLISSRFLLKAITPNILALMTTTGALFLVGKFDDLPSFVQLGLAATVAYVAYAATLALFPSERKLIAAILSMRHG